MLGIRRGTISALLAMFMVLAGCCILLPTASAQVFLLSLDSRMDHSPFLQHQGTITVAGTTYSLPYDNANFPTGAHSIRYNPESGFVFRYWYVVAGSSSFCYFSDPNSQSTTLQTPQFGFCSVGAVYDYPSQTVAAPVGGVMMPVNTLAILAPWLAVIGLVGCISAVVVIARKSEK